MLFLLVLSNLKFKHACFIDDMLRLSSFNAVRLCFERERMFYYTLDKDFNVIFIVWKDSSHFLFIVEFKLIELKDSNSVKPSLSFVFLLKTTFFGSFLGIWCYVSDILTVFYNFFFTVVSFILDLMPLSYILF